MCRKRKLLRTSHSYSEGLYFTGGVLTKEFPIRIQFFPLDKPSSEFSSSNLICQKSCFAWNFKFLQILMHTEESRETIINVWYFIDIQYSFTNCKGYTK